MGGSFKIRCCCLSPLLNFVLVSSSFFSPLGWTLAPISASKITPKSIQDRFDTSKGSQEASKTDFRALKSRPKAFDSAPRRLPKGVLEAPKRLLAWLLDRLRHQQGFITSQTHSDLSLSWKDQFSTWLRGSDITPNSSYFIVKKSQGWTTHILPKTKGQHFHLLIQAQETLMSSPYACAHSCTSKQISRSKHISSSQLNTAWLSEKREGRHKRHCFSTA